MFPMKHFEYISADRPVRSTPLEVTRERHEALKIGGDSDSFTGSIARGLARGTLDS